MAPDQHDDETPQLPTEDDAVPDVDAAVRLAGKLGVSLADLAQVASPSLLADAFGVPPVVGPEDDPDAPRLPYSPDEPEGISSLDPSLAAADVDSIMRARRDAKAQRVATALDAAIDGRPYAVDDLPDGRALCIALMRVLVEGGVERATLIRALLAALDA
jgi:hypothetical protein